MCVTRGIIYPMTTATNERIPALTLGWRLKMALTEGKVSREEMADQLGVTVSTLSRWQGDRGTPPARAYVAQWALITGVSRSWLEHGIGPSDPGDGSGEDRPDASDAVAQLAHRKRSRTHRPTTQRYAPIAA